MVSLPAKESTHVPSARVFSTKINELSTVYLGLWLLILDLVTGARHAQMAVSVDGTCGWRRTRTARILCRRGCALRCQLTEAVTVCTQQAAKQKQEAKEV